MQGHVDCTGEVEGVVDDGFARRLKISVPDEYRRYLVEHGSITVDGVSLTVANLTDAGFEVSLIPETLERMKKRDHDSPEDQTRRAEEARTEMEAAKDFDYVVVNETGRLEETARRVVEIIVAEKKGRGPKPTAE